MKTAYRIKERRKELGLTATQLAERLGIHHSTIYRYENGDIEKVPTAILANIAKILDTTPAFLMGWENTSVKNVSPLFDNKILHLDRELKDPRRSEWISNGEKLLEEQMAEEHTLAESTAPYDVKARTELAAGIGHSYDDNDIKTVQVTNEPPRHDLASIVNGDSMLPDYENGDVVYLKDTGFSSYSGQVCAVVVNDKTYLKKVYTEEDCLRLVSINPKYGDIVVDFPPSEDTHIKIYAVIGSDKVLDA